MSVFKVHKSKNFTIISNGIINNRKLSWKARGILIYLLSKPDDWTVKLYDLINNSENDGEVAVKSALKELRKYGYAHLRRGMFENDKNETVFGSFYDIYETPIEIEP